MIGKAVASLGLFGLAGLMVYYRIDPCCLGLILFFCMGVIWSSGESDKDEQNDE